MVACRESREGIPFASTGLARWRSSTSICRCKLIRDFLPRHVTFFLLFYHRHSFNGRYCLLACSSSVSSPVRHRRVVLLLTKGSYDVEETKRSLFLGACGDYNFQKAETSLAGTFAFRHCGTYRGRQRQRLSGTGPISSHLSFPSSIIDALFREK